MNNSTHTAARNPQARYACPRHPEIRRNSPGHCPICGMALEPLYVVAGTAEHTQLDDISQRL